MLTNILYFIAFLLSSAFLIWMDYIEHDTLNLISNIFQAFCVIGFVRMCIWIEDRIRKKPDNNM